MSDFMDNVEKGTEKITNIAYYLDTLSDSFFTVGNDRMGETLNKISKDLLTAQSQINNAISKDISDQVNRSFETSKTILTASLAGMAIAKGDDLDDGDREFLDSMFEEEND